MSRGLLVLAALNVFPMALQGAWYSDCMACERHLGGNSKIGPFEDKSECDYYVRLNKGNNYPYRDCYSDGATSGSGGSTSSTGLEDSTAQALAHGITYGNAESFGLGLLGLGTMAMLNSGSSAPSPAEQAARRRAQQEEWERHQAAEAERRRKFEEEKGELVAAFKGSKKEKDAFGLDEEMELKDVPASPRKKKFKPPRLKPMPNPLRKQAGPEDFTGGTVLPSWEQGKAFTRANGGTMARESSGIIRWCPKGYPYSCGGDCYTARAHQDFKIPCSSTLLTLEPED